MKEVHSIICDICKKSNPYAAMVTTPMWEKITNFYNIDKYSILCMDCMEKGLQRSFQITDFRPCLLSVEWGIF